MERNATNLAKEKSASLNLALPNKEVGAMRRAILWFVALAIASVLAQQSRPASDPQVVEASRKEGRLIIYSSTDQSSAQALLDDFRKLYPFIQI